MHRKAFLRLSLEMQLLQERNFSNPYPKSSSLYRFMSNSLDTLAPMSDEPKRQ